MTMMSIFSLPPKIPVLETERLQLTLPPPEAAPRVVRYLLDNAEHFAPWSPPRPTGYYDEGYWRQRLAAGREDFERGGSMQLMLFERPRTDGAEGHEGRPIGECNFSGIVRGAFQAAYLGYQLDHRAVGRGLMREALEAALRYAMDELRLHRIMANYMPTNTRSAALLRRLGFVPEGYARDYLYIAGAWRDHVLTALTNPRLATPER
jgi:ribosomal-protein-alanine N-acetyltransferase